jgi:hypothetical protein
VITASSNRINQNIFFTIKIEPEQKLEIHGRLIPLGSSTTSSSTYDDDSYGGTAVAPIYGHQQHPGTARLHYAQMPSIFTLVEVV